MTSESGSFVWSSHSAHKLKEAEVRAMKPCAIFLHTSTKLLCVATEDSGNYQAPLSSFAILICKLHWFLQKAPVIIWYSYTALYNVYSVKHLPRNSPASVISEGLLHHLIHNLIREGVKHQKQRSIQPTESDTSREKYNKPQRLNDSIV